MADALTDNYKLTLIQVGASRDTWGGKANDNFRSIDLALKTIADRVSGAAVVPNAGVVPHFSAPGMTGGRIYVSPATGQDPTSQPGDLWLGY